MRVEATAIPGAMLLRADPAHDSRGFFARVYCREELSRHGLDIEIAQSSLSSNPVRGTLRGLHYQTAPFEESKLVTCIRGAVFDVVVDLRPESPTYRRHFAATLRGEAVESLFVPKGCAHGFLTLDEQTLLLYQISAHHQPEHARGLRYDDPALGIRWPFEPLVISERDRAFALLETA